MKEDLKEILFSEEVLAAKIKELANRISEDYKGKDLVVVGILKGSVIFAAELIKNITIPCEIDFMAVSSYGNSTETSGVVRILKDLDHHIEHKHVLIVEDIVDTGVTLNYLLKYLKARKAAGIEIVSLLNKPARRKVELDVKPGDKVRIISGPFADFDADIIEVYPDKSKLRANVSIFGRETPVELEYKQINKL